MKIKKLYFDVGEKKIEVHLEYIQNQFCIKLEQEVMIAAADDPKYKDDIVETGSHINKKLSFGNKSEEKLVEIVGMFLEDFEKTSTVHRKILAYKFEQNRNKEDYCSHWSWGIEETMKLKYFILLETKIMNTVTYKVFDHTTWSIDNMPTGVYSTIDTYSAQQHTIIEWSKEKEIKIEAMQHKINAVGEEIRKELERLE